jgi:hypothetical protein
MSPEEVEAKRVEKKAAAAEWSAKMLSERAAKVTHTRARTFC